jgi:hypothetical protein
MKPIALTVILAIAFAPLASAQEGVRDKIRELENKAGAAQAEGRAEEAEKLRNAARELAERTKAEPGERADGRKPGEELRAMLGKLRAELEEASKAGKLDAAGEIKQRMARIEKELRGEGEKREGAKREFAEKKARPDGGDAHQKLQHLGEAIEHLHAAGMHEPAERLAQEARALKQQLAHGKEDGPGKAPHPDRQLAEMREGMMNLQRQMQEIQKRLEELSRERK